MSFKNVQGLQLFTLLETAERPKILHPKVQLNTAEIISV
jgi:hypothetical protein